MGTLLRVATVAWLLPLLACGGSATTRGVGSNAPLRGAVAEPGGGGDSAGALAEALATRLTVWVKRDGTPVYAPHCRNAAVDCRERIAVLAALLEQEARAHDLDPWLLAAIAVRESGLDPSAIGARGEAGIVQLHPRGAGHDMRYVHDDDYREDCLSRVDACQGPVVARGAESLADSIRRCGGVAPGLGRYASGRCTSDLRYVGRVLRERRRLLERPR